MIESNDTPWHERPCPERLEHARECIGELRTELAAKGAEIATLRYLLARADSAIQKAAMAMGSTDEWTSQETMIADFEARFEALHAERAKPTQSDVGWARDIADMAMNDGGYSSIEREALRVIAAIRAEGSAERAPLEAERLCVICARSLVERKTTYIPTARGPMHRACWESAKWRV